MRILIAGGYSAEWAWPYSNGRFQVLPGRLAEKSPKHIKQITVADKTRSAIGAGIGGLRRCGCTSLRGQPDMRAMAERGHWRAGWCQPGFPSNVKATPVAMRTRADVLRKTLRQHSQTREDVLDPAQKAFGPAELTENANEIVGSVMQRHFSRPPWTSTCKEERTLADVGIVHEKPNARARNRGVWQKTPQPSAPFAERQHHS